jgi:hypothetical protein
MASNIIDPITAHFKFTQGIHRFGKDTNPNTRKAHEKDQREKAKLTGADTTKDVGSAEITAQQHTNQFIDSLNKVKNSVIAKPFKPKTIKPIAIPPVVHTTPVDHSHTPNNQPHNTSPFFNNYANKFKHPKF